MKTRLLFLLLLLPGFGIAQILPEHVEEVKLPGIAIKAITIDQPIDAVYAFLCSAGYLNLKLEKQAPAEVETIVTEVHTFTDQETYDVFQKAGKTFYNVYTFNIPAKWKLTLKALNDKETVVGFQLLSYYLDPADDNYAYARGYKKYKHIVSNDNLEGLIQLYAKKYFTKAPILAVPFSREKGFDNLSYKYDDFLPGNHFKEKGTWNSSVPENNIKTNVPPGFILYCTGSSTLYAIEEKNLKVTWQQQIPFIPKEQNHNRFTLYDGVVYLPTNSGNLSAIDARTGKVYWECSPMAYPEGKLAIFYGQKAPVSDSLVYVNDNKCIYAINRFSGRVRWSQKHGGYGFYNYTIDDNYLYKSGILELFQINKRNGEVHKIINSTQANTFYYPNLLLGNNLILCDGDTYAYDLRKDKIIWTRDFSYDHILPAADRKSSYLDVLTDEKAIVSIDNSTGKTLWSCRVIKEEENAAILDFQQHKGQLCILAKIEKDNTDRGTSYKLLVIDEVNGKIIHNQLLTGKPFSNLLIDDREIVLLTNNGFTHFNKKLGSITERKFVVNDLVPDSDYSLDYIERIPAAK